MKVIEFIALIFSLAGAFLVNKKSRGGFYAWLVSNSLWIGIAVHNALYFQAVMFVVFIGLNFHGLYLWRKG